MNVFRMTFAVAMAAVCLGCGRADKTALSSPPKIPFGALDNPPEGATVHGKTVVDGWALFEEGVDHVAIYIDRSYVGDAGIQGRREDVVKVYPQFASVTNMAFRAEVKMGLGKHEISARIVGRNGASRDLIPHRVNCE